MTRYNYRNSDFALERAKAPLPSDGISFEKTKKGKILIERLRVENDCGARAVGKPIGHYNTVSLSRLDELCEDEAQTLTEILSRELLTLAQPYLTDAPIVAVGLGNRRLTPDALGPLAVERIRPTRHIRKEAPTLFSTLGVRELVTLLPGVSGERGMDAAELLAALGKTLSPCLFITVDAIMTRSFERLGASIQLSDTGIIPGGGVANARCALSQKTLGAPVLSVGLATVCDFLEMRDKEDEDAPTGMLLAPSTIDEIVEMGARIIGDAVNRAFSF